MKKIFKSKGLAVFLLTSLLIVLIATFQNCTAQRFMAIDNTGSSQLSSIESSDDSYKLEYTRSTTKTSDGDLDIIWIIDNSGSMSAEAEHVRNNFEGFLEFIQSRSNTNTTLISSSTGSISVEFPKTILDPQKHLQFNQSVGSKNALSLLLKYMPDMKDFLRQDSKKMFVLVTDDDSKLSYEDFVTELEPYIPVTSASFYAFIGLGSNESPCQAKTGSEYLDLVKNYGGKTYNICESDWVPYFEDLKNEAIIRGSNEFKLITSEVQDVRVFIDDKEIFDFTIQKDMLYVPSSYFEAVGEYKVKVLYSSDPSL